MIIQQEPAMQLSSIGSRPNLASDAATALKAYAAMGSIRNSECHFLMALAARQSDNI